MPITKANNLDIYYEVHGSGEPLVLITGLGWVTSAWFNQVDAFKKNFQVILLDNRGAGRTEAPDAPYSTLQMAQDVAALLEVLNIPAAHILGHSLGGCVAQQIAIHYPQKVKSLILFSTFAKSLPRNQFVLGVSVEALQQNIPIALRARAFLPWIFGDNFLANNDYVSMMIAGAVNNPNPQKSHAFLHQVMACCQHDTTKTLHKVTAPTLIIVGEEDVLTPLANSQQLATLIPQAKLSIVPHAGHIATMENPEYFNDLVLSFLQNL